ncbi:MAG: hypothetical protein [Microviridae sp.]|nr:MAG: hypothetical protein [Microviridae sp.]
MSNLQLEIARRETEARNAWFVERRRLENPWSLEALRSISPTAQAIAAVDVLHNLTSKLPQYVSPAQLDPQRVLYGGMLVDPLTGEIDEQSRIEHNRKKYEEAADPCRHAKETRRHMILQSGHGGRNGFTDYKKHTEC